VGYEPSKTPSKIPRRASAANPCQGRNSPPFGESSCLARVCPLTKSRRVFPAMFTPPGEPSPHGPTPSKIPSRCARRKPCQARNSPPFGESSCLARVCPCAKPRRVPPFSYPSLPARGHPNRLEIRRLWRIFVPGSNLPLCEISTRFPAIFICRVRLRLISRPSRKSRAAARRKPVPPTLENPAHFHAYRCPRAGP